MNELSDGNLLSDFALNGSESALAELMSRHGATVRNAAFGVVGDMGAAEDIAQGVFLTLVRKAATLDGERSLAGWLHRVAVRLALDELRTRKRRAAREKDAGLAAHSDNSAPGISSQDIAALHEEIAGLPGPYREPVILHHLQGMSYEAAATALGCNAKTFSARLTRAREKLRKRLIKRGITLGAAALVAALGETAAAAELPAGFVLATCAAAKGGAVSAKVAALTQSALKMLFWAKVKTVAAVCAGVVLVGGAGVGVAVTLPLVMDSGVHRAETGEMSSRDAWIGELLARVEKGSWDILDLEKCRAVGSDSVWHSDHRPGAARRFWSMGQVAEILFDDARWQRGVVTARIMILPDGDGPSELAPPVGTEEVKTRISVDAIQQRNQLLAGNSIQNSIRVLSRAGMATTGPGPYLSLGLYRNSTIRRPFVSVVEYAELLGASAEKARWYRCVLYFDRKVGNGVAGLSAAWLEEDACPSADDWKRFTVAGNRNELVGLGLHVSGGRVLVEGLKFVPFEADLPPPPWDPAE